MEKTASNYSAMTKLKSKKKRKLGNKQQKLPVLAFAKWPIVTYAFQQ